MTPTLDTPLVELRRTARAAGPHPWRGALAGGALATAACSVVYAIGRIGEPIRVVTGWAPDGADLTLVEMVLTIATSVAAGGLVLWLMDRRSAPGAWRRWVGLTAAVALLSTVPLWQLEVGAGSKLGLSAMHVLTGASAIAGQHLARRPQGWGSRQGVAVDPAGAPKVRR